MLKTVLAGGGGCQSAGDRGSSGLLNDTLDALVISSVFSCKTLKHGKLGRFASGVVQVDIYQKWQTNIGSTDQKLAGKVTL